MSGCKSRQTIATRLHVTISKCEEVHNERMQVETGSDDCNPEEVRIRVTDEWDDVINGGKEASHPKEEV